MDCVTKHHIVPSLGWGIWNLTSKAHLLNGFFPDKLALECFQDKSPMSQNKKPSRTKLQSEGTEQKTFSLSNKLSVWGKGSTFTCKANHNYTEYKKTISICHKIHLPFMWRFPSLRLKRQTLMCKEHVGSTLILMPRSPGWEIGTTNERNVQRVKHNSHYQ